MLSKKCKYALQALEFLAGESYQKPVLVSEIASAKSIPKKFLELILLDLKNHGVVQSKKGKGGGYFLGKPPEQISIGHIVRIIDGPLAPIPCVSQMAYAKCEECRDESTCGIRSIMKDARDAMASVLDQATLADVLNRVKHLTEEKHKTLIYHI
jgi:Rrf2 family protein